MEQSAFQGLEQLTYQLIGENKLSLLNIYLCALTPNAMSESAFRIKDIAKQAGVSIGTVDRVIHNRGKVSAEARKKVLLVLEKINYKPNLLARSLSRSGKVQIAILLPDPSHDEYWRKTAAGLNREIERWAHHGIIFSIHEFDLIRHEDFSKQLENVIAQNPEGIVLAPVHYEECRTVLSKIIDKTPVVLFNSNIVEIKPLSFIGQDLNTSGRVAAHLIRKSVHQSGEIGIIHMDEDLSDSPHLKEKETGFLDYFNELKATTHSFTFKRIVIHSNTEKQLMNQLEILKKNNLVGLYITTSNGTSVVSRIIEKLTMPNLVVVGYDLLDDNVRLLKKGVITYLINQNPHLLASTAIANLLDHLVNRFSVPAKVLFPLDVITPENVDSYLQFQQPG